jgi:hypothetical protein
LAPCAADVKARSRINEHESSSIIGPLLTSYSITDNGDRRGPRRGSRAGVLTSPNTKALTRQRTPKAIPDILSFCLRLRPSGNRLLPSQNSRPSLEVL